MEGEEVETVYNSSHRNRVGAGTVESNEASFLFGKVGDIGTC